MRNDEIKSSYNFTLVEDVRNYNTHVRRRLRNQLDILKTYRFIQFIEQ